MPAILKEYQNHILTLTLNRPEVRNTITEPDMIEALLQACEEIKQNNDIRVVILTGAGKGFCSGGNVKAMSAQFEGDSMFQGSAHAVRENYRNGIQKLTLAFWSLEVPVIAAVNGAAVGAGCDIAMTCDIRIMSEAGFFAESFVKLGIIAGDGGAWLLPKVVGFARASEMALTGEPIDPQKSLQWGLVSKVTTAEDLMATAGEIAAKIAANPPLAVRATKQLLRDGLNMELKASLNMAASTQAGLHQTKDHQEAVSAFLEKRTAVFMGA